jgi:hypothetical protein
MGLVDFARILRKNLKLVSLMKRLGKQPSISEAMDPKVEARRERAREKLFDLIEGDRDLRAVMAMHGATRETLAAEYLALEATGAGQWVGGAYIPPAAIATLPTLEFILRERKRTDIDNQNKAVGIASTLIEYYGSDSMGLIPPLPFGDDEPKYST